jgi:hypothetical protein
MQISNILNWARLSLGGTVLGISIGGLVDGYLSAHGHNVGGAGQQIGAISGTLVAAVLVKLAHVV